MKLNFSIKYGRHRAEDGQFNNWVAVIKERFYMVILIELIKKVITEITKYLVTVLIKEVIETATV
ncbi:MAG: hypothetical protein ABIK61_02210 [candidate division WOR-3 bacterium]